MRRFPSEPGRRPSWPGDGEMLTRRPRLPLLRGGQGRRDADLGGYALVAAGAMFAAAAVVGGMWLVTL